MSAKKTMSLIAALIGEATPIETVRAGARLGNRVQIAYSKKTAGDAIVVRDVRPYEEKGRFLYATDTLHGAGKIHSFIKGRILDAEVVPNTSYKPVWPVKMK